MNEPSLAATLLNMVLAHGPLMLGVVMFIAAVGVPIPTSIVLIGTGIAVHDGLVDGRAMLAAALAGVLLGDAIDYALGRFARQRSLTRLGETSAGRKGQAFFERRGGMAIFLTRFLLTGLSSVVSVIAGAAGYPAARFALIDLFGKILYLLELVGTGYLVGGSLDALARTFGEGFKLIFWAFALGALILWLVRRRAAAPNPDQSHPL